MAHTAEETLIAAQAINPVAHEVSPTHPGEDNEWWVANEEHDTFAVGTWAGDDLTLREYRP